MRMSRGRSSPLERAEGSSLSGKLVRITWSSSESVSAKWKEHWLRGTAARVEPQLSPALD